jgi:hypothetical protein
MHFYLVYYGPINEDRVSGIFPQLVIGTQQGLHHQMEGLQGLKLL